MIDDELLAKFDRIQALPVSEEMLGAYFEGNLSDYESIEISTMVDSNPDLSFISYEIESSFPNGDSVLHQLGDNNLIHPDFALPEIHEIGNKMSLPEMTDDMEIATLCESQLISDAIGFEPLTDNSLPNTEENKLAFNDSSEIDCQSLDTDSDSGMNENMFNENLDL